MAIIPRDLDVDFTPVPRHWLAGNAAATAVSNGLNLLFPAGERFFVRSVKHFANRIADPELRAQVRAFAGQEARHAKAHDQFADTMRAQGYEVDRFLGLYERISRWIEDRQSPEMRLAITAAAEHFTATLAAASFRDPVFDVIDPRMRDLLAWHAAEEIEHKAVAFDVLREVDPSYRLRVLGLVWALVLLGGFWFAATTMLLRQDKLTWRKAGKLMQNAPKDNEPLSALFARAIRAYVRRDFHPSQIADDDLATSWFAARGLELPEAA